MCIEEEDAVFEERLIKSTMYFQQLHIYCPADTSRHFVGEGAITGMPIRAVPPHTTVSIAHAYHGIVERKECTTSARIIYTMFRASW